MISDRLDLGETWSSQHKKEIAQDLSCTYRVLFMVELQETCSDLVNTNCKCKADHLGCYTRKEKTVCFLDCTVNNNNKCTECLGTQACVASIKSSICLVEGKLELNYPASYIHTYRSKIWLHKKVAGVVVDEMKINGHGSARRGAQHWSFTKQEFH